MRWMGLLTAALVAVAVTASRASAQSAPPVLRGTWTAIVHGFQMDGDGAYAQIAGREGWMRAMADRIAVLCNDQANIYQMSVNDFGLISVAGNGNWLDPDRHHVIMFDWAKVSNIESPLPGGATTDGYSYAAAEALRAFLHAWDAYDKVFALIGHSRGSVVVSELCRTMIHEGSGPQQVIYIDGEGRGVSTVLGSVAIYSDSEFDAWQSVGFVAFDNVFSTYAERVCPFGLACLGLDLGQGASIQTRCMNLNLGNTYAHSDLEDWECTGAICLSAWPAPIQDFVNNNLSFLGGLFDLGTTSPTNPQPPRDPFVRPAAAVFNGDFEWNSWAGWYWHGGTTNNSGTIVTANGSKALRLARGDDRSHSLMWFPECAVLGADLGITSTAVGDCQLRVSVQPVGAAAQTIELLPLSTLAVGTMVTRDFPLPPSSLGHVCRLTFSVEGTTGIAGLLLDSVRLGPWSIRSSSGPAPRSNHAMAFDAARGRTVLFGGVSGGVMRGDTWEWDGTGWVQRADSGPAPRENHALAYDAARGVTVLFGGTAGSQVMGDTWEWDGNTWVQRPSGGPQARRDHAMAFDTARGRTVLFGGNTPNNFPLGDTWEWDGSTWIPRPTPGPPARRHHAMTFDQARGVIVLFGGLSNSPFLGDTWEWDGNSWLQRSTSGPSARRDHALAFNAESGRTVLFGGLTPSVHVGDTWEWDGIAWLPRSHQGPSPRRDHALVFDIPRSTAVLFGGTNTATSYPDTWEWPDCTPGCYPDCNSSGTLTIADFGCFQSKFAAQDPYADCNQSGTFTIADFGCFQSKFAAGCP